MRRRDQGAFPSPRHRPGLKARAAYLHRYQLIPVARTAEALSDLFGCPVSAGTIHRLTVECSEALAGAEARIKDSVTAAPVIGADETGLRVAGQSHWVHVARTDRLTHYAYSARRGKEAMDSTGILPAYTGAVVSDAMCAYRQYRQSRHGLCGAHLLRELTYIKEICAEQPQWTEPLAKLLLEIKAAGERVRAAGGDELAGGCGRSSSAVTTGWWSAPQGSTRLRPAARLPARRCRARKYRSRRGARARRRHW